MKHSEPKRPEEGEPAPWESLVDRIIREAQESGAFDDLAGKGEPLRLDCNPLTPREWQLAFHVLQNAGYKPGWIEKRKTIEIDLESARAVYRRSQPHACEASERQVLRERFQHELAAINKRIDSLNLEVPHPAFQMRRLQLERELNQLERED